MAESRLKPVTRLQGHTERVWSVAWRPGASPPQLASCGADRVLRLWGPASGAGAGGEGEWRLLGEVDATEQHSRTLRSLAWSPSGDVLAVASFDSTTSLWKEERPEEGSSGGLHFEMVGLVTGHENEVKCAAFSPSGELLATCSRDKSVWIFEADRGFDYECVSLLQSHSQDVKFVQWHPSQDVLFSCSYDDSIKVWASDGDDWSCKETLVGHTSTVWSLAFDPTGSRFVTASEDCTLRVWAPGSSCEESSAGVSGALKAALQRGVSIGRASYVAPLFRWSSVLPAVAEGPAEPEQPPPPLEPPADASQPWRCIGVVKGAHDRPIYAVAWTGHAESAAGGAVASASGDNRIRVFAPAAAGSGEGWRCLAEAEAHQGDANGVAWCPQPAAAGGALLASCGDDNEVAIWRFE